MQLLNQCSAQHAGHHCYWLWGPLHAFLHKRNSLYSQPYASLPYSTLPKQASETDLQTQPPDQPKAVTVLQTAKLFQQHSIKAKMGHG